MKRIVSLILITSVLFLTSCGHGARFRKDTVKALEEQFGFTEVSSEDYLSSGEDFSAFGREMDAQYMILDFTAKDAPDRIMSLRGNEAIDTITLCSVYFTDARQYEEGNYGHLGIVMEEYRTEQDAANAFLKYDPALENSGVSEASDGRIIREDEDDKYRVQVIREDDLSLSTCTIVHLEGDTLAQITFTYSTDLDRESGERVIALLDELGIDHPAFADIVH